MKDIGLVYEIDNLATGEPKYLITNQCVANTLYSSLVDYIKAENPHIVTTERSRSSDLNCENCLTVETLVIANVVHHFRFTSMVEVFYYRDKDNREVDLVIRKTNYDEYEGTEVYSYNLFEIQMTNDPDTAASQTIWLSDISFLSFFENEFSDDTIRRIGILYMGEDKLLDVSNNTQLSEFKNQSEGIRLISIESILNDSERYLDIGDE